MSFILIAIAVAAICMCAAYIYVNSQADRLLRDRRYKRVIVDTKSGASYRGCLQSVDRYSVVLHQCELVTDDGFTPVDGELVLPRDEVAFIQRP